MRSTAKWAGRLFKVGRMGRPCGGATPPASPASPRGHGHGPLGGRPASPAPPPCRPLSNATRRAAERRASARRRSKPASSTEACHVRQAQAGMPRRAHRKARAGPATQAMGPPRHAFRASRGAAATAVTDGIDCNACCSIALAGTSPPAIREAVNPVVQDYVVRRSARRDRVPGHTRHHRKAIKDATVRDNESLREQHCECNEGARRETGHCGLGCKLKWEKA